MVSRKALVRSSGRRERHLRHRVAQHARSDRVALGMVGIKQAVGRCPIDHLGQLPSQIHRILHTDVEALSTHRVMHVCGVAGQQDPSVAIGRGLPRHIGEPGDPGGTVDPVIGPVYGDERLAEIAQGGFAGGSEVLLGHHDPHRPPILQPVDGMDAEGVVADAPFRRLPVSGHLDLGDQVARCRIPPGELDAGFFADQTASSVAPDEILRPQRLAVGQLDVDAGAVLRETRHLTSAIDRHRQLADPAGQDALDVVLPQREPVVVPGGKVADVQTEFGRSPRPAPPAPAKGTDQRFRADRGPRWCVNADRLRASRSGPGWRAARRWQRRLPPTPTHLPTSTRSDLLQQSPPHDRHSVRRPRPTSPPMTTHAYRYPFSAGPGLGQRFSGTTGVLPQAPGCDIC